MVCEAVRVPSLLKDKDIRVERIYRNRYQNLFYIFTRVESSESVVYDTTGDMDDKQSDR